MQLCWAGKKIIKKIACELNDVICVRCNLSWVWMSCLPVSLSMHTWTCLLPIPYTLFVCVSVVVFAQTVYMHYSTTVSDISSLSHILCSGWTVPPRLGLWTTAGLLFYSVGSHRSDVHQYIVEVFFFVFFSFLLFCPPCGPSSWCPTARINKHWLPVIISGLGSPSGKCMYCITTPSWQCWVWGLSSLVNWL